MEKKITRGTSIVLISVLCVATLILLFVTSVQAQSTWNIEEIGLYSMDIAAYHSLALDSNNRPHIAFWDDTGFAMDARYGKRGETSWSFVTVDQDADVGRFSSIALDSNNYPHITYMNYTAGSLIYARWDGATWHKEVIGACGRAGLGGGYSDIALDSNDHPHISYFNGFYLDLYYATWDGTTWHKEMVDGYLVDCGHYNSIALDSNDNPHISYYWMENGYLKYAYKDGATWNFEYADTSIIYGGMYTSLALDSSDNPHISYYGFNTYGQGFLKYAWRNGGTWSQQFVDDPTTGDAGLYTSLALDYNNVPHISYYTVSPGYSLKYATKSGFGSWNIETVDDLEAFTSEHSKKVYSDIALDSYGDPHILYVDMYWLFGTFNWYLKYATLNVAFEVVDVIASASDGHFSVTIDAGVDKGAPITSWSIIDQTNIDQYIGHLIDGNMALVIQGQLENPNIPGQIVVKVDPPGQVINYTIDIDPFTRDALWNRLVDIILAWPTSTAEQRAELWEEIVEIILLWPTAP